MKFMDGNVNVQNPDGSFVTNDYSDRIPDGITNPGYTEKWKEAVVRDHGDVLDVGRSCNLLLRLYIKRINSVKK